MKPIVVQRKRENGEAEKADVWIDMVMDSLTSTFSLTLAWVIRPGRDFLHPLQPLTRSLQALPGKPPTPRLIKHN